MTDKQKKEEIKQVVTNLGNIEFTVEDELKFCKEVLKRKEQECEELKEKYLELKEQNGGNIVQLNTANEQLDQLKKENEELKKSVRSNKDKRKRAIEKYLKLKEFTNKEFNKLKVDNEAYQNSIIANLDRKISKRYRELLDENDQLKQVLQEIRQIAETLKADICSYCDSKDTDRCDQTDTDELQQIINKCEVINDKSIL